MKLFKSLTVTLLSLSLLTLTFCKKEDPQPDPKACFTVDNISITAEDTVIFKNCSVEGDSYKWDFGDSTTSTKKEPTHMYPVSGVYEVSLKVTNTSGSKTIYQDVTVLEKIASKMTISKLVISKWPAINISVGQPWDPSDGPDLFYKLYENGNLVISASEYKTDCVNGTPYSFLQDFPFETTKMAATYKFEFYDYDGTSLNELMGGMQFRPSYEHNDGVSVIHMSNTNWEFDVHVTWEY